MLFRQHQRCGRRRRADADHRLIRVRRHGRLRRASAPRFGRAPTANCRFPAYADSRALAVLERSRVGEAHAHGRHPPHVDGRRTGDRMHESDPPAADWDRIPLGATSSSARCGATRSPARTSESIANLESLGYRRSWQHQRCAFRVAHRRLRSSGSGGTFAGRVSFPDRIRRQHRLAIEVAPTRPRRRISSH